ncbi:19110_t:CDS:2, partial [Racocetra persica]
KPRKRIFVNSEQDVMRFVNNLTLDRVLEKNEAQLVQAAFRFDDLRVASIATPWEKVVAFNHEMPYPEIQAIHSREFFTRYPILNQKKEDKLDKVLTKLQTTNSRMAVIQEKKKLLGIITLQDVLSALVGKIKDEKEILLLPRR